MPDLKPWEKAAQQTSEQKPWEIAASKKKVSSDVSGNTFEPLPTGLNNILTSQANTTKVPQVLTPKAQKEYVNKIESDKKNLSDRLTVANDAFASAQGQQAAEEVAVASNEGNNTLETPEAPVGNFGKYIYNKLLSGTGSIANAVTDLAINAGTLLPTGDPYVESGDLLKEYRKEGSDKVRNFLKDKIGATVSQGLERKYNEGMVTGALGGLAESVPAMAGSGVTGGATLFAQMYDAGLQSINAQPGAEKLDDNTKTIYAATLGLIQGGLEKYGLEKVLKGTGIVNAVANKILKSSEGKKLTGDALESLIDENVKGLVGRFVKGGVRALDAFATEFGTGASQEVAADVSERLLDKTTKEPVFNTADKEGWAGFLERVGKAGVQEGIGGGVLGGAVGFLTPSRKASVTEKQTLINNIDKTLNTPGTDPVVEEVLTQRRASLLSELDDEVEAEATEQEKLSPEALTKAQQINTDIEKVNTALTDEKIPAELKPDLEAKSKDLEKELGDVISEGKKSQEVLTKAETDLEALKQVNDKVKKYDASLKRLTEAKNNGQISENEFNEMKTRFDDVIGDSAPKQAEENINIQEEPTDAIQESTTDEILVQPAPGDSGEVVEGISESGPENVAPESEGLPEQEEATALRNEDIAAKRKELGFDDFEEIEPQTNEDLLSETTGKIREEGFDAKTLIDDILTKNKPITAEDVVGLKQYQLAKENELVSLNDEIISTIDNPTAVKNLIAQRDIALNELNDSQQAGRKAGTITARALQARKIKMLQDFSLANMYIRKFSANGDRALSEDQKQEVTAAYEDIKAKNEALEQKIAELETKNVDNLSDKAYKNIQKEQRKAGKIREREAVQKEIDSTIDTIRKKLKEQRSNLSANPIPVDMIPDVIKLAKLYAEKGLLSVQEVADNIYADLKDTVEGLNVDHIKAVIAQGEPSVNDPRLKSYKTRTANRIADIRDRTTNSDFTKRKIEPIKLDEEALELRDALEEAKYKYDVALFKDELANRTPEQKVWANLAEVSGLFRAAKSTADLSAVLRQGLIRTVSGTFSRNPTKAAKMFFEMLHQTVSEKRYNRWMYDLQSSPEYIKMKEAGLYIADIRNPKLTAKEEAFQSNWINLVPYYGREGAIPKQATNAIRKLTGKEITKIGGIVKGSERAYASYLNMQRVDVFMKLAQQMEANQKTFESDPEAFKQAAKFANEVTGRGDLGPVEDWKGFLSFSLFSPRLIASRVRLLTNPVNPVWWRNTPKEVKLEYVKDLGKLSLAAATVLWAASTRGYEVEDDPRSSDFLKIKDGDTRLDILGGFVQFLVFGFREGKGETKNSFGEVQDLTNPETSYDPTRLSTGGRFAESKISPFLGMTLNLARGKDYLGNEYSYKDLWKEMLPLSASDKVVSMVQSDPKSLQVPYKYLPFSLLGVGTSAYKSTEKEFPANNTVEGPEGEKVKLSKEQVDERQKYNEEFISEYGSELTTALEESGKLKSEIHRTLKARANKYSEAKLKEKYPQLIK